MALFILTLNVCSAQIWSNTCRKISPIKYEDVLLGEDGDDGHEQLYLPDVLKDVLPKNPRKVSSRTRARVDYKTF